MNITIHCVNEQNMLYWQCAKNTMREMRFERDYLPGVVAAEMGDCSEPEALKAQAIAARSFAYQYWLKNAAIYDTGKAQAFLASRVVSKNYIAHRKAAEDTTGIIICFDGKPANTHFSHSNGGYVRKSTNAWEPGGYPDPWDGSEQVIGHGSGMSQLGAENAAKQGKTFREILAFYYPGTELKGDYGKVEVATQAVKESLTADHVGEVAEKAVKNVGVTALYGYWAESGLIDTMPIDRVCFLFNRKGNKMAHVSIYDPVRQSVIQAGGYLGKGVHENPFKDCRKYFTHWATLRDDIGSQEKIIAYARAQVGKPYKLGASGPSQFDCSGLTKRAAQQIGLDWYHGASTQWDRGLQNNVPPAAPKPAFPVLRMEKPVVVREAVKTLQNLLNQHGAELKVDGKFGPNTKSAVKKYQKANGLAIDGVAGAQTWNSLTDEKQS